MKKHEAWMCDLVRDTNNSAYVLSGCLGELGITRMAKQKLAGAHIYLYAAMIRDFVLRAETEMIGVDGVRMPDGSIQSSRQFLLGDIIENMLRKLPGEPGNEFASRVRTKLYALLDIPVHAQASGASERLRAPQANKEVDFAAASQLKEPK